ncbi:hypothetical protein [Cohnella sp. GCM10027633]|uniref:hypothetical protein n=1 Tax=unclassified Cohnella TaxID=2636738 RepID=UPI0036308744
MDVYHAWIYVHMLNTEWFMWTLVLSALGTNVAAPFLLWYYLNKRNKKNKKPPAQGQH